MPLLCPESPLTRHRYVQKKVHWFNYLALPKGTHLPPTVISTVGMSSNSLAIVWKVQLLHLLDLLSNEWFENVL
ncbi:hypothetical protein CDAR_546081 [Caerostris darwini]|uniref:Uncharacterized protein n=1 Tax=Caerostris darwini TaxID=1538125 RepID=A0AAV4X6D4_9ARAC|nr:hypothetical protein CDAR_546081 [Caerostris darwini]